VIDWCAGLACSGGAENGRARREREAIDLPDSRDAPVTSELAIENPSCAVRQLRSLLGPAPRERTALQSYARAAWTAARAPFPGRIRNPRHASRRHLPHALNPAHRMIGLIHQRLLDP